MPPANFADRLHDACQAKNSVVCVGLDPRPGQLPPQLAPERSVVAATESFCRSILEAVADLAVAVKPNIAFFEALGPAGVDLYSRLCAAAQDAGLLVIGDIKRGDIGSTAAAYAQAHLGAPAENPFAHHDAVTLSAYLGSDGIRPFLDRAVAHGQGLFLLVKTSNPSSAELQDLELKQGGTVAEALARLVTMWGEGHCGAAGFSAVGTVVGATHGEELARLRALMPRTPFLLPGYGAQGAGAGDVVGAFNEDGFGGVVNASRSILFAYEKEGTEDFAGAARRATAAMREDLNRALGRQA